MTINNDTKACFTFAKNMLMIPRTWKNILWTDEGRAELCGKSCYICTNLTQHFIKSTSYQQLDTMVVVLWSGAALLLQDLDDLP